ncbi:glycosyltransferase family 4 protein [Geomonas terrae]|nr:glycosyltransferase family 4 protein [Geomonas terrae]
MKRLAYLANYFPSLTETFIYREVMELKRRNVAVTLYSLRKPGETEVSDEALKLRGETSYLLPVPTGELLASHAWFFGRTPLAYLGTLFKMLTGTHNNFRDRVRSLTHFGEGAVLARRMVREGITHIHAHYASQSTSVARVVHLLTGIPYSFTGHAHDIWHDRLLLPEKLREAAFVATCSTFAKEFIAREEKTCDEKIHVVYHGLDVRKFTPPVGEKARIRNRILSVGSLGPTKGFPDLIRACALLRQKLTDFECVIVGEGPMREELERLISDLGLSGTVRLVGSVPQEGLIGFYHEAWIFVLPCVIADDGRRDGLPNVLMEAMATGLPVITTRSTAQEELIEHGRHGLLVPPHAPEELATAICTLCRDDELRESLGTGGRRRIERDFDNRTTIEPLLRLFDRYVFGADRISAGVPHER